MHTNVNTQWKEDEIHLNLFSLFFFELPKKLVNNFQQDWEYEMAVDTTNKKFHNELWCFEVFTDKTAFFISLACSQWSIPLQYRRLRVRSRPRKRNKLRKKECEQKSEHREQTFRQHKINYHFHEMNYRPGKRWKIQKHTEFMLNALWQKFLIKLQEQT